MVSIDDMDRFEEEEIKKIRPIKKTWYGWLFDCIPKPARKSAIVLKDIFISIFKTNTPKQTVYGRGQKLHKPRKQIVKKPFTSEENKQKIKDKIIKDIWKLFEREAEKQERKESEKKKKRNKRIIEDKIIRDTRTLFEQEEDYYKPKIVNSFWNNIYIECESNGDKNNNLSLDEYLNKIKPSLKDIIIDLQSSWKIKLTISINFISSKDTKEERVMYSTSNNIKFTTYNDVNEVVNELVASLRAKYQDNLEALMRGSDFIFDSVQLMHCKCHKVNFKCGE